MAQLTGVLLRVLTEVQSGGGVVLKEGRFGEGKYFVSFMERLLFLQAEFISVSSLFYSFELYLAKERQTPGFTRSRKSLPPTTGAGRGIFAS